ncbi:unnamed protein product [Brassicogethes aeneus]|uniref:tRNA(His) guanylyltransferase n=1 Tax=Brassicogethes aeneus TaxID=1431903 RepID=A0A9P0B285_BRAAE|nr:unnamed protein product [Brassicogethes aeneus]
MKLVSTIFKYLEKRSLYTTSTMAKSKFEYVKNFECDENLLPNCWIVVRVDGKSFHKFTTKHSFKKPNDSQALWLMNKAASVVMDEFKDILLSYGQSDEYSFVLRKDSMLYNRRKTKIMTYINSLFSSAYVFFWNEYFPDVKLKYPPSFDSRVVLYPSDENLRDYLSWRQADCHINNLYNTVFWALVQKGHLTNTEAEQRLCGTFSSDKNEILFTEFNTNYNNEPLMYRKGTILIRKKIKSPKSGKNKIIILPLHEDLIQDQFWKKNFEILEIQATQFYDWPPELEIPEFVKKQFKIETN